MRCECDVMEIGVDVMDRANILRIRSVHPSPPEPKCDDTEVAAAAGSAWLVSIELKCSPNETTVGATYIVPRTHTHTGRYFHPASAGIL